ncbi:MAG: hypothetical protein M1819_003798 [Sarea resinae]|nr:MAG: hypothetical protein M1819_003798 [Sarea resinae]
MTFKVLIIGGGLAGSLLANGLVRNGVDVEVYDRDVVRSKREGYQIRLGAQALQGMHTCLDEETCREIIGKFGKSGSQVYTTPILYSTDLQPLRGFTRSPPYSRSAPISRVVLRDALAEPLIQKHIIRYEKKYVRCQIIPGDGPGLEKVRAHFEDGTFSDADIMVAADGSGSRINAEAGPNNIVERRERVGFLTKGQLSSVMLRTLPAQLRAGPIVIEDDGIIFIASAYLPDKDRKKPAHHPSVPHTPRSTQAGHSPQSTRFPQSSRAPHLSPTFDNSSDYAHRELPNLPSSSASRLDSIRSRDSDSFSSHESHFDYDEAAASLMWNMNIPHDKLPDRLDVDDPVEMIIGLIAHWDERIHDIIRAVSKDELYTYYGRVGTSPAPNWREVARSSSRKDNKKGNPRIWFIGDSMHPMLPTRAMGGNQAMYDSGEVCNLLSSLARQTNLPSNNQVATVLSDYEASMLPRAFEWVTKSNNVGGERKRDRAKKLTKQVSSYKLNSFVGKLHLFFVHRASEVDLGLGVVLRKMGKRPVEKEKEFDMYR